MAENDLNVSLESKLHAKLDALIAAQQRTIEQITALLATQPKAPIVPGAVYKLAEVAALVGCRYNSVLRAAGEGHLKVMKTAVCGRQAKGSDVLAWLEAGGRTGRNKGSVETEKRTRAAASEF